MSAVSANVALGSTTLLANSEWVDSATNAASAARFPHNQTSVGWSGHTGEPDVAGKPKLGRGGDDAWPTIVAEVGHSMSLADLRLKKDFWFNESGRDVHVVVLLKMFPLSEDKQIWIEKWQSRDGRVALGVPTLLQTVIIKWKCKDGSQTLFSAADAEAQKDPANFEVIGAPLSIGFRECFLFSPVKSFGTPERNIILTGEELQGLAANIWFMEGS
ncbi:hypothetical protein Sste5346_006052 [Sporothrix stenoceras]|uniref:Uncharacterized protein n=1 Tax=Sporothrix stenoceras TaxID=5173 RepID=A0ABR3Z085_9PEZI